MEKSQQFPKNQWKCLVNLYATKQSSIQVYAFSTHKQTRFKQTWPENYIAFVRKVLTNILNALKEE